MKNIVIVAASLRKNGNSNALASEFARGARDGGNKVSIIYLADKRIEFCRGCVVCQKTQKCVIADDAVEIAEEMKNADVLVFATPIYYYSVSGKLKTMLDRANSIYPSDYKFRDVYLLATAADESETAVHGAQTAVQGWVDCFERAKLAGVVFAGGVNDVGDVKGHEALKQAYAMGQAIK